MKRIDICSIRQVKESSRLYGIDTAVISTPNSAAAVINAVFNPSQEDREVFGILTLDTKNKVSGAHVVSVGSLNSSPVHPREVFKLAILNNASSIILWHNHPSGDVAQSREDTVLTNRLVEAGKILGIAIVDHIIIGEDGHFLSFREQGLLPCL